MNQILFQLTITLFLLYDQVGVSFLAGVAFSIILIPINKIIANKIGKLSTEMMKQKDERVNLMCDLIRGVKTVKAHVWEDYFINRVSGKSIQQLAHGFVCVGMSLCITHKYTTFLIIKSFPIFATQELELKN